VQGLSYQAKFWDAENGLVKQKARPVLAVAQTRRSVLAFVLRSRQSYLLRLAHSAYLWLASPRETFRLKSADLPRGMLSDFHWLDRKCLARKTICPTWQA
jgi:hypothetical protein